MAVRFILGRSGTGKTRYCMNSIVEALCRDDETPLILLVPEQATYQAERAILADGRIQGYSRLSVLSFDRLGYMLTGRHIALDAISRSGRQMVIEAVLSRCREEMRVFGPSSHHPGMARELCRALIELQQADAEPEDIEKMAAIIGGKPAGELAAMKFADMAVIYRRYQNFLSGRFANPDMELSEARKAVPHAHFLENARLWVDGFAGFTRQEFELLIDVLKAVKESEIAICIDPEEVDVNDCNRRNLDPTSLFHPTECTYADLLEAVRKSKLKIATPLLLKDTHRFISPELAWIERSLSGGPVPDRPPSGDSVRLFAAPDARSEAGFAAANICRLVRSGHCRYREIAVVVPDVATYRHYIEAAFVDCGIPFFLDTPLQLAEHPLPQLVISALRAATEDYESSHVFAFLKSGLGPLALDAVNMLENYCVECGAGSSDWTSAAAWHFAPKYYATHNEAVIDRIRREAVQPLEALAAGMATADGLLGADDFTAAVFGLIDRLNVRTRLEEWRTDAADHRRFFDRFVELFDEFAAAFEGLRLTPREYTDALSMAVEEATLAIIPPTLDQVLVGTIDRSRHPDLKAVILVDCTQSRFPTLLRRDSVLTDDDRLAAEAAGLQLADTVERQLAARQYLAYIAMTRASEHLLISWPLADEKGSPLARSEFID
ncbi:MAG TPA: 3'-5' exonuclease, partial [Sedimentisphaerales bacterium]|nr:3'-5' exonuclease [Sedimentisphaerales bacterium]